MHDVNQHFIDISVIWLTWFVYANNHLLIIDNYQFQPRLFRFDLDGIEKLWC